MALILGVDTSTLILSLALIDRPASGAPLRVLEAFDEGLPRKQSEMLPGVVGELLTRQGVSLTELACIAVGLGPGSFTGLRIGLSCVKALAYATRVKVTGVSSLKALALDGPLGAPLFPCTSARKGELYVGSYRRSGRQVETLTAEEAGTTEWLAERLKADPSARAFGAGLQAEGERLRSLGVPPAQLLTSPNHSSAVAVAELAHVPDDYDEQALFALEPHYLRPSEPERNPRFPPLPGPERKPRLKDD